MPAPTSIPFILAPIGLKILLGLEKIILIYLPTLLMWGLIGFAISFAYHGEYSARADSIGWWLGFGLGILALWYMGWRGLI